jgi:hypothetical protein
VVANFVVTSVEVLFVNDANKDSDNVTLLTSATLLIIPLAFSFFSLARSHLTDSGIILKDIVYWYLRTYFLG